MASLACGAPTFFFTSTPFCLVTTVSLQFLDAADIVVLCQSSLRNFLALIQAFCFVRRFSRCAREGGPRRCLARPL